MTSLDLTNKSEIVSCQKWYENDHNEMYKNNNKHSYIEGIKREREYYKNTTSLLKYNLRWFIAHNFQIRQIDVRLYAIILMVRFKQHKMYINSILPWNKL